MPTPKLKACPFCASPAPYVMRRSAYQEIHCQGCGAKGPSGSTESEAAERWNWRRRKSRTGL